MHHACDLRWFTEPIPVPAVLRKNRDGFSWVVKRCPYCGDYHVHGGGGLMDDPMNYLGDRTAPCAGPVSLKVAYILVEDEGKKRR